MSDEKQKALGVALDKIEKSFGKGSVIKMGSRPALAIDTISSGSLGLDIALGLGGFPRGRIVEIYGPESSGKTTVCLHLIAEAQKLGGIVAFIDAEHALDPVYAKNLGVDIDELYISQPDNGEQGLEIADEMVRSGAIDLIVIDSVAALVPLAEIEGDMGGSHVGLHARLMSQALRKLTAICSKNNCIIMFTNQLREKIGIMFGNPETTTGGRALKFYSSVRLDIRKGEAIKQGDKVMGNKTKVKVVKNKVAPPFMVCEFDIVFGEGISKVGEVLDLACGVDIINKSGSWFSYGNERLGQGRENVKAALKERPELLLEIEAKVRAHYGIKMPTTVEKEEPQETKAKKAPAKKTTKAKKAKVEEAPLELNEAEIDSIIGELGLLEDEADMADAEA